MCPRSYHVVFWLSGSNEGQIVVPIGAIRWHGLQFNDFLCFALKRHRKAIKIQNIQIIWFECLPKRCDNKHQIAFSNHQQIIFGFLLLHCAKKYFSSLDIAFPRTGLQQKLSLFIGKFKWFLRRKTSTKYFLGLNTLLKRK